MRSLQCCILNCVRYRRGFVKGGTNASSDQTAPRSMQHSFASFREINSGVRALPSRPSTNERHEFWPQVERRLALLGVARFLLVGSGFWRPPMAANARSSLWPRILVMLVSRRARQARHTQIPSFQGGPVTHVCGSSRRVVSLHAAGSGFNLALLPSRIPDPPWTRRIARFIHKR